MIAAMALRPGAGSISMNDKELSVFNAAAMLSSLGGRGNPLESMPELWQRLEGCWRGTKFGGHSADANTSRVCCLDGREEAQEDVLLAFFRDTRTGMGALMVGKDATMNSSVSGHGLLPSLAMGRRLLPVQRLTATNGSESEVSIGTMSATLSRTTLTSFSGCWLARVGAGGASL